MKRHTAIIVSGSVATVVFAVAVQVGVIALIFSFLAKPALESPVRTSAGGAPSEVTFLNLPESAASIRYWEQWHDRIAVFESSEAEFRAIFPSVPFVEIVDPKTYFVGGFGDAENSPWRQRVRAEASSGLFYQKIVDNGGGETILYDRSTRTGFYEYGAW